MPLKLLLHVCCAPCSTTAIERLTQDYDIAAFFYNPNIHPSAERQKRMQEFSSLMHDWDIESIVDDTDEQYWFEKVEGLGKEPEGGKRCEMCYRLRLEKTARAASEKGYDLFATTLTLSPLKKAEIINQIGQDIASKYHVSYLGTNFKKQDGFKRSIELSHEHELYRQNYCGCIFSQNKSGPTP